MEPAGGLEASLSQVSGKSVSMSELWRPLVGEINERTYGNG